MPPTPSSAIPLGAPAPDFALRDGDGGIHRLADYDSKPALLVAFLSNRCPFVLHIRQAFAAFASFYWPKGLAIVAINSNDAQACPEESEAAMQLEVVRAGYFFPYLKDLDQSAARRFGVACTPDFFLYDADRKLAYHGQFDCSRPKNGCMVTGADLRLAADAVLAGRKPNPRQIPSTGCDINWKARWEPAWFAGTPPLIPPLTNGAPRPDRGPSTPTSASALSEGRPKAPFVDLRPLFG